MKQPVIFHCWTPLHAGIGQVPGIVDLPFMRRRPAALPCLSGASIRGALRRVTRRHRPDCEQAWFGPPQERASEHSGDLITSDALLFALPIPTLHGTYAWVTSGWSLEMVRRTLNLCECPIPGAIPAVQNPEQALVASWQGNHPLLQTAVHGNARLFLQDLDLGVTQDVQVDAWANWTARALGLEPVDMVTGRFVVVHDEVFSYLCLVGLQLEQRVRLEPETRIVARTGPWSEESLPAESLLLGFLGFRRTRGNGQVAEDPWTDLLPGNGPLAFGGDHTIGRGVCGVHRVPV